MSLENSIILQTAEIPLVPNVLNRFPVCPQPWKCSSALSITFTLVENTRRAALLLVHIRFSSIVNLNESESTHSRAVFTSPRSMIYTSYIQRAHRDEWTELTQPSTKSPLTAWSWSAALLLSTLVAQRRDETAPGCPHTVLLKLWADVSPWSQQKQTSVLHRVKQPVNHPHGPQGSCWSWRAPSRELVIHNITLKCSKTSKQYW